MEASSDGSSVESFDSGHREFLDGCYLIKECIEGSTFEPPYDDGLLEWYDPGTVKHGSQTAFLLKGEETLLFDTLDPSAEDALLRNVDELLGPDEGLDYLVISHPEANHAGNAGAILQAYPEATLVVPERGVQHELFDIGDDAKRVVPGDVIDLGGHEIQFVEPAFYDHNMTVWMYERTTKTLYTVDFLGFGHMAGDCLAHAHEMTHDVTADQLDRFNGYAFVWFRFVDPDRIDEAIDALIDRYDVEVIAPAHGQNIHEDPERYLRMMKDVIRDISEQSTDYHVHHHQLKRLGK